MVMGYIWTGMILFSILSAVRTGNGGALASGAIAGAQEGVGLVLSMGGSLCLWSGVGKLLEKGGITQLLSRLLSPLLNRLFPTSKEDIALSGALSGNITANFLGLGNAATPMGIRAARLLQDRNASDELCRLVVLNTASIQLLPTTVAAVRAGLGCRTPFDILPAVWVSSLLSAGLGVTAAVLLGKLWKA